MVVGTTQGIQCDCTHMLNECGNNLSFVSFFVSFSFLYHIPSFKKNGMTVIFMDFVLAVRLGLYEFRDANLIRQPTR